MERLTNTNQAQSQQIQELQTKLADFDRVKKSDMKHYEDTLKQKQTEIDQKVAEVQRLRSEIEKKTTDSQLLSVELTKIKEAFDELNSESELKSGENNRLRE